MARKLGERGAPAVLELDGDARPVPFHAAGQIGEAGQARVVRDAQATGEGVAGRIRLILPAWLSYLALDAGLREQENEVEVLLVHTPAADVLKCCEPSDVNRLNHQACRTPLGEFTFSSVTSSGLVSTEELFLDLMNLALDSADVKCLMLLPFHQVYGNGVEEKLAGFFKDKNEEERGKAVYFITEEPLSPVYCRLEPVFYSLAHAFGIKSDEL